MSTMLEKLKALFKKEEYNKKDIEDILMEEQEAINKLYEEEGLTDKVLDRQVALNQKRNELDISDPTKRIWENFVQ